MKNYIFNGDIYDDEFAEILRYYGFESGIICPSDVRNFLSGAAGEDVTFEVNSPGGVLVAGTEIYSVIKNYGGNTTALVQSYAASAATVAIAGCRRITAERGALLCAHNPSTVAWGDAREMYKAGQGLENIKEALLNIYEPRAKISREEMSALMDKDEYIDANRALEVGLIDDISDTPATAGGEDIRRVVNSARALFTPSQKMIDDYRAAKAAETQNAARTKARAILNQYR